MKITHSKVTKIEKSTSKDIFYLSVKNNANYFANKLCVHNCYRGDLGVKLYNFSNTDHKVLKGDRVAQIAYFPLISLEPQWSEEVEETDRGANGFGQSGK